MYIVNAKKLRAFAEAVVRLEPYAWASEVDPDQVKILAGEMLDLWPWSIFSGTEDDEETDAGADEALA